MTIDQLEPIRVWSDEACEALPTVTDDDVDLSPWFLDKARRFWNGDGNQAKELVRAGSAVWMAKSGIPDGPIALPLHEALTALFYRIVDLKVNDVVLGSRRIRSQCPPSNEPVPVAFHKFEEACQRSLCTAPEGERFLEDFACMRCVDLIVGHADRSNLNYMIFEKQLFVVDNGKCMANNWWKRVTQQSFADLSSTGGEEHTPWSADLLRKVLGRMASLSREAVDICFDLVPSSWIQLHDDNVKPYDVEKPHEAYHTHTMHEKRKGVKRALAVFNCWASTIGTRPISSSAETFRASLRG